MVLEKVFGAGLILLGVAIVFVFPDIVQYQPKQFAKAGILFGIFLIILGAYLILV